MMTRILLISALILTVRLSAAETSPEDLLRQGLFEEEANRDFDKASERYRAVVATHDRQRSLAATATFRLGEIARKKNDKESAVTAFRTVAERFPEQEDLARLSRENLTALGITAIAAPVAEISTNPAASDPEETEILRLQELARNSPDLLDGPDSIGWRPLHHAAKNGWTKVISYLLENKADPSGRTARDGLTPLQIATLQGHLGVVTALLAAKADISASLSFAECSKEFLPPTDRLAEGAAGEWSALDLAVLYDRRQIVRALIKAGADVKHRGPKLKIESASYNTLTTLLAAIYLRHNELALLLIEAGSPLTTVSDEDALSPLTIAVRFNPGFVTALLKAGADPNYFGGNKGWLPLYSAVSRGQMDIAQLLIAAGADPKRTNSNGRTPLHLVASPEMVDYLISKGADPNARDMAGNTPLDMVNLACPSYLPTFEALLKHGAKTADPNALLKRTMPELLPVVLNKAVYPQSYRPDAILLSFKTRWI